MGQDRRGSMQNGGIECTVLCTLRREYSVPTTLWYFFDKTRARFDSPDILFGRPLVPNFYPGLPGSACIVVSFLRARGYYGSGHGS